MSAEALAIALNHSRAKGTAKLVLIGIANHDGDGGAWPSIATLARYANVDRSTVQRAISTLEALGEVRRLIQEGGTETTPHRPNLYRVMLQCPPDCDRTAQHRTARSRQRPTQLEGLENVIELSTGAAPTRPAASAPPIAPTRPIGAAPTRPEPVLGTKTKTKRATHGSAREAAACGHPLIDDRHCTHGCLPKEATA